MNSKVCSDLVMFGNCTKGRNCQQCHQSDSQNPAPILNIGAKEFIPKKKSNNNKNSPSDNVPSPHPQTISPLSEQLLKLNLDAKEYKPSVKSNSNFMHSSNGNNNDGQQNNQNNNNQEDNNNNDDYYEEPNDDELDMIMKDMLENDDVECEEESDDEKWFPKFKNCECCKGFVFKCKGNACQYLGACYCKVKSECDDSN